MSIKFRKLMDTYIGYKNKYIRFTGNKAIQMEDLKGNRITLPPKAIGLCYAVNGMTMHVAFKKESMDKPPTKSPLSVNWEYHISIRPHGDDRWEIEI